MDNEFSRLVDALENLATYGERLVLLREYELGAEVKYEGGDPYVEVTSGERRGEVSMVQLDTEKVEAVRGERGVSPEELAKKADMPVGSIERALRGERVEFTTAAAVGIGLDMSVSEFRQLLAE